MYDLGLTPSVNPVSNLVYSGNGLSVDTTIVNGKVLMSNKQLLTLDEEQVKSKARTHIVDLLKRADPHISTKWPIF